MAKFIFRLETVLKQRTLERDRCRLALAEALALLAAIDRQIAALTTRLDDLSATEAARPGALDIERLLSTDRYAQALRRDLVSCRAERSAREGQVARCRANLVSAEQAVRTLEILREKQHAQFLADAERRQQLELDDMAARDAENRISA